MIRVLDLGTYVLMDPEILTVLVRGGHINMPDRIEQGFWPHPPIKLSLVEHHLAGILRTERWFPHEWHPHKEGQAVHEGGVIERKDPSKYIYRAARAWPTNPFAIAEVTEKAFSNPEEAAAYYLKWDLHLPGDLDGWKVVE